MQPFQSHLDTADVCAPAEVGLSLACIARHFPKDLTADGAMLNSKSYPHLQNPRTLEMIYRRSRKIKYGRNNRDDCPMRKRTKRRKLIPIHIYNAINMFSRASAQPRIFDELCSKTIVTVSYTKMLATVGSYFAAQTYLWCRSAFTSKNLRQIESTIGFSELNIQALLCA